MRLIFLIVFAVPVVYSLLDSNSKSSSPVRLVVSEEKSSAPDAAAPQLYLKEPSPLEDYLLHRARPLHSPPDPSHSPPTFMHPIHLTRAVSENIRRNDLDRDTP